MKRPTGRFWIDTFFARKSTAMVLGRDLAGKTVVFTGGTDGMGRAAVERLASMGADICLLGRNMAKAQRVVSDLREAGRKAQFPIVECDLGSLDSVRKAASDILGQCVRIDLLINCAGANVADRKLSPEGYEMNFAVNYLGPFLLTELLLERVRATPSARIVNLTSGTQKMGRLDFDDLHRERKWSLFATYAQAKLCMIMHSRDVAGRLENSGATINCLNPGYIRSSLTRDAKGWESVFVTLFGRLAAPTWVGGERIEVFALIPVDLRIPGLFPHWPPDVPLAKLAFPTGSDPPAGCPEQPHFNRTGPVSSPLPTGGIGAYVRLGPSSDRCYGSG
ncbi:MAG: SDR family NAD(P)-dependent oxidoreductase [Rhodospirillaceae bacterium]|nr:SDR family NAD(P)-dependent oxidoreductase [Rhodospirillaceae bacterium]